MTLAQLAARTRAMAARAAAVPEIAAARLAPVMVVTAREIIGTHVLRDLMESTQRERERLNYPPNDPLLRDGSFRDSIVGGAEGPSAWCGSSDVRAEPFEHGTPNMRPFANFALTKDAVLPKAVEIGIQAAREALKG